MKKINSPLVSVILSVYNDEKFLQKTINCLIDQIYQNIEIIIINDGSNDSTYDILEKYKNNYNFIKLIHNKKNFYTTYTGN